jgi:NitT/TauT family transport system ATP-binding protein
MTANSPSDSVQAGAALEIEGVTRSFGTREVLGPLDLAVARGEWLAIVGPSGCGKTTLLNLMSGFDAPSAGRVERRGHVRTVYQSDGLFPWLSVRENIALGLRHLGREEQEARVRELAEWIGLGEFTSFYPHQLSGGMKQRVEIARALAGEADVLLFDEPFSSLDYITRLRLRREIAALLHASPGAGRRTLVMVTHDIEEATQLADRVVVLSGQPSRIICEVRIDATHPRSATQHEVVEATQAVIAALGLEDGGAI